MPPTWPKIRAISDVNIFSLAHNLPVLWGQLDQVSPCLYPPPLPRNRPIFPSKYRADAVMQMLSYNNNLTSSALAHLEQKN